MYKKMRGLISILVTPFFFEIGWFVYLTTNRTPNFAYQSMITLFCFSRGKSNDFLSRVISVFRPAYLFAPYEGILGKSCEIDFQNIGDSLNEDGFFIFENRLSDDSCEKLLEFARTQKCVPVTDKDVRLVFNPDAPQANRYDFTRQDLLKLEEVQKLIADPSLADVAQRYLGARPLLDEVVLWWSTNASSVPDEDAAQLFHFDMDKPKWIKFFFCLIDIDEENGPHVFVKGSHKTNGIPMELLKNGYARLTDEAVFSHYGKHQIVEFTEKKGTIIAEDSRGLHKGKPVQSGCRLMLGLQFSNSGFGNNYPKNELSRDLIEELERSIERFPDVYANYKTKPISGDR